MKKIRIKKKVKNGPKVAKQPKNRKFDWKTLILSLLFIGGIAAVSLVLVFALYVIITSPDFDKERLYSKEASVIYYNDGTEMTRIGYENRELVNYDELPQVLVDAFVATEDSRFFQHSGLDIARFAKATLGQLMGDKFAGGASTITMQVVKKTFTDGTDEGLKGIIRKFTDIYMAVFKVESNYTKEEIIEFYVNSMWLGSDGSLNYNGIAGVEQASQYFFGKSVSDLTLAEATIIAGMYQNPTIYNPYTRPDNVRKRQTTVLTLMVNHGYITEEEKETVLAIPIESLLRNRTETKSLSNQAIIDHLINEVVEDIGMNPYNTAMRIYTTIDPSVQKVLNDLEDGNLYEFPNEAIQEGMAVTSIENGSIVALSGGRNYQAKGTNRAVDISRQPGSSAKPLFDYAPYIEYLNGSTYTMFLDEATTYSNGTSIKNSDGKYAGLITMRTALSRSRNIPALLAFQVLEKNNVDVSGFVHSLGIDYGSTLFESSSIGGFEGVSPLEMSAAYAAFGRKGYFIEPYIYTKIELIDSDKVIDHKYELEKVMSEETAYMITSMLITTSENGATGLKVSGTDIAGKTGTTNLDDDTTNRLKIPASATRDAWNITYSPEYSTALWIGYDRTTTENYLTVNVGNRVRKAVMSAVGTKIYSKNKTFSQPSGVISVEVELETFPAQLPSVYTPENMRITELFKAGTEPTEISTRYSQLEAPSNGGYKFSGTSLTLNWDSIDNPDAINSSVLQEHFNTYYGNHASKYFESRINYNNNYIGSVGYNIYQKDLNGNLTYLGRTYGNTYTINGVSANSTYVIKSSYSIFTSNISNGLEIKVNGSIDSNVDDIIDNNNNNNDDSDLD